jgi:hypothetical protein
MHNCVLRTQGPMFFIVADMLTMLLQLFLRDLHLELPTSVFAS